MTLFQYEAYFRDEIASKKLIGHSSTKVRFAMLDDDELATVQNSLDTTSFCLVLHKYDTTLSSNDSGKYLDKKICGISVFKALGKGKSFVPATILQSEAEVIIKKIWAKMLKDRRDGTLILTDFDTKNFKIQFLKGIFDNAAGATAEFEISPTINPFCGIYDAYDWT